MRDDSGQEKPSTKVFIDNIPISFADSEIEHALQKIGCELRSSIKAEQARNADGKLTRFLTGRRFVFVTVPTVPLDKTLKISIFTAKIYHREQKLAKKTVICSRCLETNHHVSHCPNDVVCSDCRNSGHKRGHPDCTSSFPTSSQGGSETANRGGHVDDTAESVGAENAEKGENKGSPRKEREGLFNQRRESGGDLQEKASSSSSRGRASARQTTLGTSLELRKSPHDSRRRSETPKRRRPAEDSPEPDSHKQAKTTSKLVDRAVSPASPGDQHG